jgi:hypothetical protein
MNRMNSLSHSLGSSYDSVPRSVDENAAPRLLEVASLQQRATVGGLTHQTTQSLVGLSTMLPICLRLTRTTFR